MKERDKEGEYFWHEIDKITEIDKIFKPSLETICNEVKLQLNSKKSWDDKFIYEFEPEPEEY